MPRERDLQSQIKKHCAELDRRTRRHLELEPYFKKVAAERIPVPPVVEKARVTRLYRELMGMSTTPWGKTIVNAKLDRLEVTGISTGIPAIDDQAWSIWQDNGMDLESKLGHSAALLDGRVHALVWPRNGQPEISLDDATQMVVEFEEGSRRHRAAASRRWRDGNKDYLTLYRRDGIYKFVTKDANSTGPEWSRREVPGEPWPLPNPLGIVVGVEIGTNRQIASGPWTSCRGEFEDVTGVIDRIHLLTFLGLIVAIWMGFPLRGVIGDKILQDDDGNDLPPFESRPDSVVQFESKDAKVFQLDAADRKNLAVYPEFNELALSTATPRHYLPMDGGTPSNVAEPAIRAFEGPMLASVKATHKPYLAEGWLEVLRVAGLQLDSPIEIPTRASMQWASHESWSLAERADAFVKLAGNGGLPWQAAAAIALNLTQDDILKFEAQHAGTALAALMRAARDTVDDEKDDTDRGEGADRTDDDGTEDLGDVTS